MDPPIPKKIATWEYIHWQFVAYQPTSQIWGKKKPLVLSLNNPQNSEMKICKKYKVHMFECHDNYSRLHFK